jgi:hypothetical protein
LKRTLELERPDAVIAVTIRAFDPSFIPPGTPVIVDFVDSLTDSYLQRSAIASQKFERIAWRLMSRASARVERNIISNRPLGLVAAGRLDAERLRSTWFPNTIADDSFTGIPETKGKSATSWDVLFSGTLDYKPNIAALRLLDTDIWPEVLRLRPEATLCVAGRRPTPEVRAIVRSLGANLLEEFGSFEDIARRSLVAVAPLPVATGIQNKVLDASSQALPVVTTDAVASGFDPDFPLAIAKPDQSFAKEIVKLLEDPTYRMDLGSRALAHCRDLYSNSHWSPRVKAFVEAQIDSRR